MMEKLFALIICGCLLFSLVGCGGPTVSDSPNPQLSQADATTDIPAITEPAKSLSSMNAIILPTVKESVQSDDGTVLASMSFQRAQIILHDELLEEKIVGDFQDRIGPILSKLYEIEDQARQHCADTGFRTEYYIDVSYTPTRLDQSVLSLFGNKVSYTGGAHPSLWADSVTFDLQTGNVVYLDDILSPECTSDILYRLVLSVLEKQEDDLYYDYADAIGDRFTGEFHNIQNWYFSRSGLCFHFSPYTIAPYSSGTVIAELPYSSLSGILKDQYFPTEHPSPATGSMYAENFAEDDSARFTYIAHVPLCETGHDVLLYPDAAVTDIRIESGVRSPDSNQFIAVSTVFAASTMNVGDAIHLTADLKNEEEVLRLVYHSGDQTYSSFITHDEIGNSIVLTNR